MRLKFWKKEGVEDKKKEQAAWMLRAKEIAHRRREFYKKEPLLAAVGIAVVGLPLLYEAVTKYLLPVVVIGSLTAIYKFLPIHPKTREEIDGHVKRTSELITKIKSWGFVGWLRKHLSGLASRVVGETMAMGLGISDAVFEMLKIQPPAWLRRPDQKAVAPTGN